MRLAPVDRLVSFADRPWSNSKISITALLVGASGILLAFFYGAGQSLHG
jgi:hypothetical protein